MTREALERIRAKPHGPDVDALIAEVERGWFAVDRFIKCSVDYTPEQILAWLYPEETPRG